MRPYVRIAKKYARDVVSGRIPACKWVRLSCQRQIDDLERWQRKSDKYHFSTEAATIACAFIEELPHVKGPLTGKKIELEPWQIFIVTTVFGWLNRDGHRRYRRVYIEVPRGNGKSAISSGIGLYCLLCDGEGGAEVYSAATTRDQARIVFRDAQQMVRKSPEIQSALHAQVTAHAISVMETGSTFTALSADSSSLDGLATHCAVIDELHAHKTRKVYDVIETSMGKRLQSLLWCITTAGVDFGGICWEQHQYIESVLEEKITDDTQFGIIYSLDPEDDWRQLSSVKKANPNWGISVQPSFVEPLLKKAIAVPSARNNFLTKHCDVWCNATSAWLDMQAWDACADFELIPEYVADCDCYVAFDLASKKDLASKAKVFVRVPEDGGKPHYYLFSENWLPEKAIQDGAVAEYGGWKEEGYINVTPGAVTDFQEIEDEILKDLSGYEVLEVAYDPWQASMIATRLSEQGAPMVEYRQTVFNFSEPMKFFESLVLEGRLHHDGNPVLRWCIANVAVREDLKGNIFPNKQTYTSKIDAAVAAFMAIGRAMQSEITEDTSAFDDPIIA